MCHKNAHYNFSYLHKTEYYPDLVVPGLPHKPALDVVTEELLVGHVDAVGAPYPALLPLYHLENE